MKLVRGLVAGALLTAVSGGVFAETGGPMLVMPFERLGEDSRLEWLGEGAAVLLADCLNTLGASALTRAERVEAFEQLSLPASAGLTRATIIKVGHLLGATEVVVGSFEVRDEVLTVRARGIEIEAGRLRPEVVEAGPLVDLFTVFDRLARRLSGAAVEGTPSPTGNQNGPPVEAFEHYVKGLVAVTPANRAKFLSRAIELHAGYDDARLAMWSVRSEQGDHEAALLAARGVTRTSPVARQARFGAALSLIELRRYDEAFGELSALVREGPAAALFNNLGIVQLRRGGSVAAGLPTFFFTRAADMEPGAPDYAFNLGYAYALQGDMEAARYWLREVVRRNPADADAHFVLGLALEASAGRAEATRERALAAQLSGRYEGAEGRAGRIDAVPKNLERLKRTLETLRAERLDAAILGTVQREQGELAQFHLDQGRRFVEQERDRDAIAELRRSIYLSPYLADAHLLLGQVYARSGRPREAVDTLKIAIWSQESVGARLALARVYLQLEDEAAARTEVERALVLDPASVEAKRLLEQLGKQDGRRIPAGGGT